MEFGYITPEGMERFMQRHAMISEDARTRTQHMVEELEPEQLAVMRNMMERCVQDTHYAAYMEGIFSTLLRIKHGDRCQGCGGDHLDHAEALGIKSDVVREPSADERMGTVPTQKPQAAYTQPTFEETAEETLDALEGRIMEQLLEYNVQPVNPANITGAVVCNGCETVYVSLADRMLREPGVEGCGGCQNKAKFG